MAWPLAALVIAVVLPLAILFVGAWLSGWRVQVVETGSMEPTVTPGSAIVVEPIDASDVRVGMAIAFADESRGGHAVTHRVIEVVDRPAGPAFRTQGDANDAPDTHLVAARAVRGRMRWHVPYLGSALRWLRWPWGFLALVVTPLAVLLVGEASAYRRRARGTRQRGTQSLRALPETYELALRLRAEGVDVPAIGRVLDVETESVAPLLSLGESKLVGPRRASRADVRRDTEGVRG